jgi:hypothetical protein
MTGRIERQAESLRADARGRLPELLAARRRLRGDADDPWVLSELVGIEHEIEHARQVIRDGLDRPLVVNERTEL